MRNICAVLATAFLLQFPMAVLCAAQDISLVSRDGAVRVDGDFLSFDGQFYRVETEFGVLTIDSAGVDCDGPACVDAGAYVPEVRFSGAVAIGEGLIPALIHAFAARNGWRVEQSTPAPDRLAFFLSKAEDGTPVADFMIRLSTSEAGFRDLFNEGTDIALSLRDATRAEVTQGIEAGIGRLHDPRRSRVLALDALVPYVSPYNTLKAISLEDLADVLAGNITNWSELGGADAPISLHIGTDGAALALDAQSNLFVRFKADLSPNAIGHSSQVGVTTAIRQDPYALGLGSLSAPGQVKALALTGPCGFHAHAEAPLIKAEDYPLSSPLYAFTPARLLPHIAEDFLNYSASLDAQLALRAAGFVDQGLVNIPMRAQGARLSNAIRAAGPEVSLAELQEVITTLEGADRLSMSFRFQGGSSELDAQSRSNASQLARAIEAGQFDGQSLIFVGFSDGDGRAALNKTLSERRAQAVERLVRRSAETYDPARLSLTVAGFGEALPIACDDAEWGRDINRRVEVWVR